jgi:hypothetical protein
MLLGSRAWPVHRSNNLAISEQTVYISQPYRPPRPVTGDSFPLRATLRVHNSISLAGSKAVTAVVMNGGHRRVVR